AVAGRAQLWSLEAASSHHRLIYRFARSARRPQLIAAEAAADRAPSFEKKSARPRCGCGRAKLRRARRGRESGPPRLRRPAIVPRTCAAGRTACAPSPWRARNPPLPCPRPSAALPRSCGRIHRLQLRAAPLVSAQTARWYLLLCRVVHTHSSLLTPASHWGGECSTAAAEHL